MRCSESSNKNFTVNLLLSPSEKNVENRIKIIDKVTATKFCFFLWNTVYAGEGVSSSVLAEFRTELASPMIRDFQQTTVLLWPI